MRIPQTKLPIQLTKKSSVLFSKQISLTNKLMSIGFSEIDCRIFKQITKRNYKNILLHQYNNGLIFTNIPLNKSNTGRDDSGKKITRGYKVDRAFQGIPSSLDYVQSSTGDFVPIYNTKCSHINSSATEFCSHITDKCSHINILSSFNSINSFIDSSSISSISSISIIPFNIPSYQYMGTFFEDKNGKYDIKKVYEYIDMDEEKIPYREHTPEWECLVKTWNKHTKAYKNGNRIFSWFHNLHGDERSIFTINRIIFKRSV